MNKWNAELFACHRDLNSCLILSFFPLSCCIFQGLIVTRTTGESFVTAFCASLVFICIGSAVNRGKIRDRYMIRGSLLADCLVHMFCPVCAVSQEYRELMTRGYDDETYSK